MPVCVELIQKRVEWKTGVDSILFSASHIVFWQQPKAGSSQEIETVYRK
jgi:hypothetical protein